MISYKSYLLLLAKISKINQSLILQEIISKDYKKIFL